MDGSLVGRHATAKRKNHASNGTDRINEEPRALSMNQSSGRGLRFRFLRRKRWQLIIFFLLLAFLGLHPEISDSIQTTVQDLAGTHALRLQQHMNQQKLRSVSDIVIQQVLAAELDLVDIAVSPAEFENHNATNSYGGIYGVFCRLDWKRHKRDPTIDSFHFQIVDRSRDCQSNRYPIRLDKIAEQARQHDRGVNATNRVKVLNFTAAVFHETRCGSTMVANTMANMDIQRHRVYSEALPPFKALTIVCGGELSGCVHEGAIKVFDDVMYLMRRSTDPKEERVFFKFQSQSTYVFPDTPWIFLYRDPIHVLVSQFLKPISGFKTPQCLMHHHKPTAAIQILAKAHGKEASTLTKEEACGAFLGALTETAAEALNPQAIPVDYADLPHILHTRIFPGLLGRPLTESETFNVQKASQSYSKDVSQTAFVSDNVEKESAATPPMKQAAETFMYASYEKLKQHKSALLSRP